ncbi:protein-L-isoaspartate(D-aspartate) O-methyltransferase [Actinomadura pelletieri DSM 43383]|uniref:Protein-L-isoaspartate O-methyltransferase n=1 Tax=Actinomadura pelletieri DSM 43383 TaxID=1120940 RepID=A0A495QH95_9ACTN|nr:protein-L-isoaspartate(D-aspartate) O-methyltransferase [Actinomadura pelletieri]RKS71239.1 protein-L-isoaspartate(D-aspartate) O-methyltransferase [Actinomadura pelletieri DSM 43383]
MARTGSADERLAVLIAEVQAKGHLPDPADLWVKALRAVPRHAFVPTRAWTANGPIDRDERPDEWWDAVYSDAPIITQADDGATDPSTGRGDPTSSLSALSGVLYNFGHLDLDQSHRVLEIGTGTGYSAALTTQIVGETGAVVSVEVDPELTALAEKNLAAALPAGGPTPTLIVEDGADGYSTDAPYDRVHATCSVQSIPPAWLAQTRPGGRIVTPYGRWFGYGLVAQVDVLPDGTGVGRFPGTSGYMPLRSQRPADDHSAEWDASGARVTRTSVNPRTIAYAPAAADLVITHLAPGIAARRADDSLWLLDGHDPDCWAIAVFGEHENVFEVRQHGNRDLWDEVADAYFQWQSLGRPVLDRLGLTVDEDGEHLWLDRPDDVIA